MNKLAVNGVRVKEHPLQPNDVISFGGAATVGFGCSVQTHKRKPVSSIFVYKFREKEEDEGKPLEPIPNSVESGMFALHEVFIQRNGLSEEIQSRFDGRISSCCSPTL